MDSLVKALRSKFVRKLIVQAVLGLIDVLVDELGKRRR